VPRSVFAALRPVLIIGLLGLSLAACGRRGPLEPPPDAKNPRDLPAEQIGGVPTTPGLGAAPLAKPAKTNRQITPPDVDFVLDPLL